MALLCYVFFLQSGVCLSKAEDRKNFDAVLSSRSRLSCHLGPFEFKDNDSFDDCLQLMKRLSLVQHLKESESVSNQFCLSSCFFLSYCLRF